MTLPPGDEDPRPADDQRQPFRIPLRTVGPFGDEDSRSADDEDQIELIISFSDVNLITFARRFGIALGRLVSGNPAVPDSDGVGRIRPPFDEFDMS
jgi:hypothetical protein